jgi:hypothetical protein
MKISKTEKFIDNMYKKNKHSTAIASEHTAL